MTDTMAGTQWYAIQTYSGHEKKVQRLIELKIEEEPGTESTQEIRQVLVPTHEVVEIRLYPGYVLVEMLVNERTQHVINTVQGVIKFVGQGKAPQPLRDDEINKILGVKEETEDEAYEEIPFHIDQVVEVTQGPFTVFSGTVQGVYPDKGKVKVEVSLFGRPTSVELDYTDLQGY